MQIVILVVVMVLVGLLMGFLAGMIWKDNRPIGVSGDYIAAVISTVAVGLLDWFVIPAMGFGDSIKWLGVALEPAASALIVLWIIRKAKE
ncbi:MAG: hypothetical protein ACK2TT_04935 [Anaerolineales bacterium]|jgi:uncharacterized membrane protein YeaQ/YmgE (transglycosylase-associated protein family)